MVSQQDFESCERRFDSYPRSFRTSVSELGFGKAVWYNYHMDLDAIPFVQARWYKERGFTPTLIVLHTMEAGEYSTMAENCANFFKTTTRIASANYCTDNDSVVCSVKPGDEAYHAGKREINRCSVGIEMAGFASQVYLSWHDEYSQDMLNNIVVPLVKALCDRYDIPKVWLTAEDLAAGKRAGITTHREVTYGFKVYGGHTDPGLNFPIKEFMAAVTFNSSSPTPLPKPADYETEDNHMFKLTNVDKRQEMFILAPDGRVMNSWESKPGAEFGPWAILVPGGNIKGTSFLAEKAKDGRLCITVASDPYGVLMGTWQATPGGGWVDWFNVNEFKAWVAGS